MEYFYLFLGIVGGVVALAIFAVLAKLLWDFGGYLKVKVKFLWFLYTFFWVVFALVVVIALAVEAFNKYNQVQERKERIAKIKAEQELYQCDKNHVAKLDFNTVQKEYLSLVNQGLTDNDIVEKWDNEGSLLGWAVRCTKLQLKLDGVYDEKMVIGTIFADINNVDLQKQK